MGFGGIVPNQVTGFICRVIFCGVLGERKGVRRVRGDCTTCTTCRCKLGGARIF